MIAEQNYMEHSREFSRCYGEGDLECFRRFGLIKLSALERSIGRKAAGGRPFGYGLPAETRSQEVGPLSYFHNVNTDGLTLITKITSFERLQNYINASAFPCPSA